MLRQGRSGQETIVQPWGRVLVPPQGIHIRVSFELFIELKPPINGRCQHSSFQKRPSEDRLKGTREAHQEITWNQIKGVQALHTLLSAIPPLNHGYKTPYQILLGGTHSFWGQEPAVSPFAWQSNKAILLYFIQNSVSEIWFSTGAQRLSFWLRKWFSKFRRRKNHTRVLAYVVG